MSDTRDKLLAATETVLREQGMSAVSARTVAAGAGVNQALVFYHFGTVTDLLGDACRAALDDAVSAYADRFARVDTLHELLVVARDVDETERASGNVTIMAQLLAAAQHDPALADTARYCLGRWTEQVETVLGRVVRGRALGDLVDVEALAQLVTSGFVGVELTQGVAASDPMAALERLAALADAVDDLGPMARRAVAARIRRSGASRFAGR